ncbi:prepilin-type N-terminal cleavage/methylation domain-containing protein [Rickettsiales bacterium]|nr:prepilin-type N-terminal cleavage/methylation domain-containing protein [Rickettsiales bacterium]
MRPFKYLRNLFKRLNVSSQQGGFSLIELSVVISVAATIAVGYLAWTRPNTTSDAVNSIETQRKISEIASAIEAFRVQRNRLPCPANKLLREDNTMASSTNFYDNDYGTEDLDTSSSTINSLTTYGVDCPNSLGSVPAKSLGLDASYMYDGWGRRFTYHVSDTLCGTDLNVTGNYTQAMSELEGCTELDYANNAGNITVNNPSGTITKGAAYVVVSHGSNGKGAYLASGAQLANDGGANEQENGDADTTYYKADYSSAYDDIIYFRTKQQIESVTSTKGSYLLTAAECNANSQMLRNFTAAEFVDMRAQITSQQLGSGDYIENKGDAVALSLMLAMQKVCVKYYGLVTGVTSGWNGPRCPGVSADNSSTYHAPTGSCSCAANNWDGSCAVDWSSVGLPTYGLRLWLDGNDTSTLYTDPTCAADKLVTADGNSVACWKDKSGRNNHAIQNDSDRMPLYKTNIINTDREVVRFDGSNDFMDIDLTFIVDNNYTIIFVEKRNTTGTMMVMGTINNGSDNNALHIGYRTDTGFTLAQWNNDIDAAISNTTNQARIITALFDMSSGHSIRSVRAGVVASNSNADKNPMLFGSNGSIGRGFSRSGTDYYNGDLAELIIYDRALSSVERTNIEDYLSKKWGVTLP